MIYFGFLQKLAETCTFQFPKDMSLKTKLFIDLKPFSLTVAIFIFISENISKTNTMY